MKKLLIFSLLTLQTPIIFTMEQNQKKAKLEEELIFSEIPISSPLLPLIETSPEQLLAYDQLAKFDPLEFENNLGFEGGLNNDNLLDSQLTISAKNISSKNITQKEKIFICTICNDTFSKKDHLNNHLKGVHKIGTPYFCTENNCAYFCFLKGDMTKHLNSTHKKGNPLFCDLCSTIFFRSDKLKEHRNGFHKLGKEHFCTVENCIYRTFYPSDLKRHLKFPHKIKLAKKN